MILLKINHILICRYMKSRLTYCQINDVIKEINKAVVSKYKILHQPKKSMSSVARNLYHRFIDEETKDTKGKNDSIYMCVCQLFGV